MFASITQANMTLWTTMPAHSPSNKTILLIEDYTDAREMLRLLLESLHYTVLEAEDADQALELAALHEPNLILTDLGLPGTDGLELVRQLRRYGKHLSSIPVVVVTAYNGDHYHQAALAAGCNAFITKPIEFASLQRTLRKLLQETDVGL